MAAPLPRHLDLGRRRYGRANRPQHLFSPARRWAWWLSINIIQSASTGAGSSDSFLHDQSHRHHDFVAHSHYYPIYFQHDRGRNRLTSFVFCNILGPSKILQYLSLCYQQHSGFVSKEISRLSSPAVRMSVSVAQSTRGPGGECLPGPRQRGVALLTQTP